MKITASSHARRAFTLIELMTASTIALIITGSVIMLLFYTAREQVHGLADNTVEEESYVLVNQITTLLHSMSSISPNTSTPVTDTNGNLLGYQSIYAFTATGNSSYVVSQIYFDTTTSNVVYIPDYSNTNNYTYWMTNNQSYVVHNLCFNPSQNPDGSPNNSFINVILQMDDNNYSMQNAVNNPASVYRSFSVLMLAN